MGDTPRVNGFHPRGHVVTHALSGRERKEARRLANALIALERRDDAPRETFHPPRPLRSGLIAAVPVVVALALGALNVLPWTAAGLAVVLLLAFAVIWAAFAGHELVKSRRLGDRLLQSHPTEQLPPLAAWRARELTSPKQRRQLQSWVRVLTRESEASVGSNLGPSSQAAVREGIALLHQLDARLGRLDEPVAPAGILLLRSLLAEDRLSPLYFPECAAGLPDVLRDALAALTPA
jgi:hypothetical protein